MKKKKNIGLEILRRITGTLFIPAAIYLIFLIITKVQGLDYFGDTNTWRNIIQNTGAAATIAYALATQIKHGRFDFSGGAIMTLGALVSIYIANHVMHNGMFYLLTSIAVCTVLSILVAFLYVNGRIPIVICTVGAAIFFESLTLIFNRGQGATISSDATLNYFGKRAGVLSVLVFISALIYFIFTTYTTAGRRAQLLASNQAAAVNIGINEKKNVIQTFIVSGILYGIASVVFASQAFQVDVVPSVLGTVSVAFTSLLPVFMGFFIGSFSTGAVGIIFSSFAVGILQYGIDVIAPTGYAGAFKNVIMGTFMIVFFLVSQKGGRTIKLVMEKLKLRKKLRVG